MGSATQANITGTVSVTAEAATAASNQAKEKAQEALFYGDIAFIAVAGFAGLRYSLTAIEYNKTVALANKETLVCGGEIVMPLVHGDNLVPVDSEHSAIWQCLDFNSNKKHTIHYKTNHKINEYYAPKDITY